ncbi:MAG: LexA family transcriptional regulator [bacterium]|nr:LexA family transcriptional regulator [bacterium]
MSVPENLKRERQSRRLSQIDLAKLANVGHNTIGQIERGDHSPTLDTLTSICQAMGLHLGDVIGEKIAPANAELSVPLPYFSDVPYEDWDDGPDEELERTYYVPAYLAGPERCAAKIRSEIMYPTLWPGDVVLMDMTVTKPKSGTIVAVEIKRQYSPRRLRRMRNQLQFNSDNPQYPPIIVEPEDNFKIHGAILCILHREL